MSPAGIFITIQEAGIAPLLLYASDKILAVYKVINS